MLARLRVQSAVSKLMAFLKDKRAPCSSFEVAEAEAESPCHPWHQSILHVLHGLLRVATVQTFTLQTTPNFPFSLIHKKNKIKKVTNQNQGKIDEILRGRKKKDIANEGGPPSHMHLVAVGAR